MTKKPSTAINVLGSLNTSFFGVFLFICGLFNLIFIYLGAPAWVSKIAVLGFSRPLGLFAYAQLTIASICYLITGQGLLKLKEWARKATLYLASISLVINIILLLIAFCNTAIHIVSVSDGNTVIHINLFHVIGGVFYPIILLYCLTRSEIKEQFKTIGLAQSDPDI